MAKGDDEEEEEAGMGEEGQSESESSEFGLSAGTDKHEAAAPAHRVHGKQAQPGQEVKREDGRERKDAKDGNDGKPAPDPSKLNKDTALTSATTVLQSIKQLTPAAVWKGTFKENEIKARLKKAGVALTDLEQYQATLGDSESNEKEKENCASVLSQMGSVVDTVPLLQEVVKELRGKKVMESLYLEEFQADLRKVLTFKSIDADTFSQIINRMASKVIEARPALFVFVEGSQGVEFQTIDYKLDKTILYFCRL